jgi:hypothetical protein
MKTPEMKNAAFAALSNAQDRFYAVPEVFSINETVLLQSNRSKP